MHIVFYCQDPAGATEGVLGQSSGTLTRMIATSQLSDSNDDMISFCRIEHQMARAYHIYHARFKVEANPEHDRCSNILKQMFGVCVLNFCGEVGAPHYCLLQEMPTLLVPYLLIKPAIRIDVLPRLMLFMFNCKKPPQNFIGAFWVRFEDSHDRCHGTHRKLCGFLFSTIHVSRLTLVRHSRHLCASGGGSSSTTAVIGAVVAICRNAIDQDWIVRSRPWMGNPPLLYFWVCTS